MMKGRLGVKTIIVFVILILVGVLGVLGVSTVRTYMSGAAVGTEPLNVNAISGEDGKSGTISWTTDKASQGVVEYGTTPASLLLRSVETDANTDHKLTLSPLKSDTSYYYRIRVGEEVFDNSGIPYSFKTKAVEVVPTMTPVPTVPEILPLTENANGCNRTTDYNSDGVVNTADFVKCMQGNGNPKPTSSASGNTGTECNSTTDYNGDGVVNSIDRIKCLQNKQ